MFKKTQSLKRNQFICVKQYSSNKTVSRSLVVYNSISNGCYNLKSFEYRYMYEYLLTY